MRLNSLFDLLLLFSLTLFLIKNTSAKNALSVEIENSPGYYHGKYCQIRFKVASNLFGDPPSYTTTVEDTFFIEIKDQAVKSRLRFSEEYEPPYVRMVDGRMDKFSQISKCLIEGNAYFYCMVIPYSPSIPQFSQFRQKVNQTFHAYYFSLKNVICPTLAFNAQDIIEFSIAQRETGIIKVSGNFSINWKYPLHFPFIRDLELIGSHSSEGSLHDQRILLYNQITQCTSQLEFSFIIDNSTFSHSWTEIIISILSDNSLADSVSLTENSETCEILNETESLSAQENYDQIGCQFNLDERVIRIVNDLYQISNISNIHYIDPYLMYKYPIDTEKEALPQRIKVKLPFISVKQKQKLSLFFTIKGKLLDEESSNIQQSIWFQNSNEISVFYMDASDYSQKQYSNMTYYQMCLASQKSNLAEIESLIDFKELSSNKLLQIISILTFLFIIFSIRTKIKPYMLLAETICYLLAIIFYLPVQITIIILTESSGIKLFSVNYFFTIVTFIHMILSGICCLTYIIFTAKQWKYLVRDKTKEQLQKNGIESTFSKKKLFFVIASFLYNYKFYCVFLSHSKFVSTDKILRLRNQQLYKKHIYHLIFELILYFSEIFALYLMDTSSSDTYTLFTVIKYVSLGLYSLLSYCILIEIRNIRYLMKLKKIQLEILEIALEAKKQCQQINQMIEKRNDL